MKDDSRGVRLGKGSTLRRWLLTGKLILVKKGVNGVGIKNRKCIKVSFTWLNLYGLVMDWPWYLTSTISLYMSSSHKPPCYCLKCLLKISTTLWASFTCFGTLSLHLHLYLAGFLTSSSLCKNIPSETFSDIPNYFSILPVNLPRFSVLPINLDHIHGMNIWKFYNHFFVCCMIA